MNPTESNFNMNIPLLNGVLRRLNPNPSNEGLGIPLENRTDKEKENELIQKYSSDLMNNKPLLSQYEKISTELLKLGYTPQQVVHSFLVFKYETIDQAIEVIANHEFIESDEQRCFICGNEEMEHQRKNNIPDENQEQRKIITKEEIVKRLKSSNEIKDNDILIEVDPQDSCPICFEDITNENKFSLKCNHVYCKGCIIDYLKEEIKNSRVLQLNCPTIKCKESFTIDIIKSLLNSDNTEYIYKYEKFLQREKIKNDPDLVVCPIVNCEGYAKKSNLNTIKNDIDIIETNIKNDKESLLKQKEKLICDKGHAFCSLCNQAWHGESPCDSDKEIKEFATYSGFIVKKCPKCKTWTEKNEGCNHMKCKICNYNWCWLCEKECKENHFFIEGTPCYGKQFNREENPDELMLAMMLINAGAFVRNFLFLYLIGMYIIKMSVFQLFRNRNNLNENNNNNQRNRRPSKCAIWIGYVFLLSILFIIMFCSNGYLLFSMSVSSSGTDRLNKVSRKLISYSNIIFFIMFFLIGGPVLNCAWYSTMVIYATYQIIKV